MQKVIAKTEAYLVAVDTTTHRMYCLARGKRVLESPAFIRDWEKAKGLVSSDPPVLSKTSQV